MNKYQNKRRLQNNLIEEYYGMKKYIFSKEFFNQNILGLILRGDVTCEIDPSNGKIESYFVLEMSRFKKNLN